jgi:hypothetical protein
VSVSQINEDTSDDIFQDFLTTFLMISCPIFLRKNEARRDRKMDFRLSDALDPLILDLLLPTLNRFLWQA